MIFYDKVTIKGNSVWYFKKRKNGKPIREQREVLSMEIDTCLNSEHLEQLFEVFPNIYEDEYVEFDIHTKITN